MKSGQIILHFILFANVLFSSHASLEVEFDAPTLIRKSELYKLIIRNTSPGTEFPVVNFAFSFELLSKLNPRIELSVADVTSLTYTGDEYRGFSIKEFKIKKDLIEMNIEFRREAHGTVFRIRYTSAKTDNEKEAFYISSPNTGIIMERRIEMFLPYTITLQTGPEILAVAPSDRDAVGHYLIPDKKGQISCQATDGLPNSLPTFENSHLLIDASINQVNNDATKLIWMVRMQDHGKQIQCRAGQDTKNITINVYHYMSAVLTNPQINDKVPQGSQIKCSGKDGFPVPKTEWNFISGPVDSEKYFELRDNKTTLVINMSTPLTSNWTFECLGSNYIPTVVAKYLAVSAPNYPIKQLCNFTIVGFASADVQSGSAGVVVVVLIFLTLAIAVVVVGIVHREKVLKFINSKRPRAGQLAKNSQKSADHGCKYTSVEKGDPQRNGTDKELEANYYVSSGEPKSGVKSIGPIDRV